MQSVNINDHFELFAFAKHADSHTEINLYRMLIVNLTSRKNIVIHFMYVFRNKLFNVFYVTQYWDYVNWRHKLRW